MKKKVYIKPVVGISIVHLEQQLMAGSTASGGHGGGGNPGNTPAEPAKFHPVGTDASWSSNGDWGDLWSNDGENN